MLVRIKRAVLAGRYAFSKKARVEMEGDGLTELDVARRLRGKSYSVPDLRYFGRPACGEKVDIPEAMRRIQERSPGFSKPSRRSA